MSGQGLLFQMRGQYPPAWTFGSPRSASACPPNQLCLCHYPFCTAVAIVLIYRKDMSMQYHCGTFPVRQQHGFD